MSGGEAKNMTLNEIHTFFYQIRLQIAEVINLSLPMLEERELFN
jgi:hypothetical protein